MTNTDSFYRERRGIRWLFWASLVVTNLGLATLSTLIGSTWIELGKWSPWWLRVHEIEYVPVRVASFVASVAFGLLLLIAYNTLSLKRVRPAKRTRRANRIADITTLIYVVVLALLVGDSHHFVSVHARTFKPMFFISTSLVTTTIVFGYSTIRYLVAKGHVKQRRPFNLANYIGPEPVGDSEMAVSV